MSKYLVEQNTINQAQETCTKLYPTTFFTEWEVNTKYSQVHAKYSPECSVGHKMNINNFWGTEIIQMSFLSQ